MLSSKNDIVWQFIFIGLAVIGKMLLQAIAYFMHYSCDPLSIIILIEMPQPIL